MKKILYYIGIGLLGFLLLAWAVAEFSEGWVKQKLKEKVSAASEGKIVIEIEELDLELFQPTLLAYGVTFRDTVKAKPVIALSIDTFRIAGIDWTSIASDGPIYLENLYMRSVNLTIEASDTNQFYQYFTGLNRSRSKSPAFKPQAWFIDNASAFVQFGDNAWRLTELAAQGTYSDSLTQGPKFLDHLAKLRITEIEAFHQQKKWLYAALLEASRDSLYAKVVFDSLFVDRKPFTFSFKEMGASAQLKLPFRLDNKLVIDTLLSKQLFVNQLAIRPKNDEKTSKSTPAAIQINTLALPDVRFTTEKIKVNADLEGRNWKIDQGDSTAFTFEALAIRATALSYTANELSLGFDSLKVEGVRDTLQKVALQGLEGKKAELNFKAEAVFFSDIPVKAWLSQHYVAKSLTANGLRLHGQLASASATPQQNTQPSIGFDSLKLTDIRVDLLTEKGNSIKLNQGSVQASALSINPAWSWNSLQISTAAFRYRGRGAPHAWRLASQEYANGNFSLHKLAYGTPDPELKGDTQYYFSIDQLKATNWQLAQLINNNQLSVEAVMLDQPILHAGKDKGLDSGSSNREKPFIIASLMDLPLQLHIGALRGSKGYIQYREKNPGADTAGILQIDHLEISMKNITNIPWRIRQEDTLSVAFNGRIMKKAPIQSQFWFNLTASDYPFQAAGGVEGLRFTDLNPVAAYLSPIVFQNGILKEGRWQMEGNAKALEGTMRLGYENLAIELSAENSADTSGIFKDIGSFILQKGFLDEERKSSNPVNFSNTADTTHSFFHYYWKSVLAGLKKSIDAPGSGSN